MRCRKSRPVLLLTLSIWTFTCHHCILYWGFATPSCNYIWLEPGSKLLTLGMVIQPLIGNPYNGYINPYYWVDDHLQPQGTNGSLDPSTLWTLAFWFWRDFNPFNLQDGARLLIVRGSPSPLFEWPKIEWITRVFFISHKWSHSVDGWNPANQLRLALFIGFQHHPRWCRISAINSFTLPITGYNWWLWTHWIFFPNCAWCMVRQNPRTPCQFARASSKERALQGWWFRGVLAKMTLVYQVLTRWAPTSYK